MIKGKGARFALTGPGTSFLAFLVVLALALTLAACSAPKTRFASGLPGMTTPMVVDAVSLRGPYLEAQLTMDGGDLAAYVLPSDECRAVFRVSETVSHVASGPQGLYRRDEHQCPGRGVGNLGLWRDRSRRATVAGVPRAQATYRVIHSDDDVALLRGRFPLASYLDFEGVSDLVAVVPRIPECQGPIEKGVASMEYRGKGKHVLSLLAGGALCPILGLIQPPSQSRPTE